MLLNKYLIKVILETFKHLNILHLRKKLTAIFKALDQSISKKF